MRILVTGGAGFIGSHIADALLMEGHQVLIVDDLSTGRRENVPDAAEFVLADLRQADAVARILGEFKPEVVDHQAAQTSVSASTREPVRDAEVNIVGSLNLFRACVVCGVRRLVFASTGGAIYGEVPEDRRAAVDHPLAPLSPYGCAKLAVESYLRYFHREHSLDYSILRYANVYGPRQDPYGEAGVVAIFANRLLKGEPIQINGKIEAGDAGCIRDYVFVRDVVRANLAAINGKLKAPVVNVCSGVPTDTLSLAKLIARAAGVEAEIRFGPRRPGDLERSVLEADPGEALGPPIALEQGIAETVDWMRDRQLR